MIKVREGDEPGIGGREERTGAVMVTGGRGMDK